MRALAHGAARGAVAAMAMTGMRRMTTALGLVERTPPERLADEGVPALLTAVPVRQRAEAIEVIHWAFGATAGAAYGLLPPRVRRRRISGPLYGLAIWAGFELGARQLLGLGEPDDRAVTERLALAADHVLYGLVLTVR